MRRIVSATLVGLSVAAPPMIAAAQREATLFGAVLAPDGARLPGVVLTLSPLPGGAEHRLVSAEQGVYRISGLAARRYRLVARLVGFAPWSLELELQPGETRRLDPALEVARVQETVDVLGAAPRDSVEAAALRESPARDVGEALERLAGMTKQRKGGIANDVVLRGFRGQDLSVLIDGQRLHGACPNRMDPPAFHVDFAEVERIEVARGPFDLKNLGSLGGAVNVVTRRPELGWHARPSLALGSYGFVNPAATVSHGGQRLSALAGFSYRRSDPYTDGDGHRFTEDAGYRADTVASDAFRLASGWGRLAWRDTRGRLLQLAYTRQQADHVLYPALLMDAVYDDTDRAQFAFESAGVRAQLSWARVLHWMTDEYRRSGSPAPRGWSMGTLADARTLGGRLEWLHGSLTAGVEATHRRWDSETQLAMRAYSAQASLAEAVNDAVGLFVEATPRPSPRLSVSLGARLDRALSRVDDVGTNTNLYFAYHGSRDTSRGDWLPGAKLRVEWRNASGLSASAGIGHAARAPEPNERYFALERMGTDWVGDPTLRPARNTGLEGTLAWERGGARVALSGYWNHVDDYVRVTPVARARVVPGVMSQRARTWANVDARLRGAELTFVAPLASRLVLSADASVERGTQTPDPARGLASQPLPEIPPARARAALRYDDGSLWLRLEGLVAGEQDRVDAELGEAPTPGYGVVNVGFGWRGRRLSLTGGVANLLDRAYYEHLSYQRDPFRSGTRVAEPGRNLFVTVGWRF